MTVTEPVLTKITIVLRFFAKKKTNFMKGRQTVVDSRTDMVSNVKPLIFTS